MPCYNAAATLNEALESLAGQTFAGFEVIAVDDGSTDGTAEILQVWVGRDERFHLIRTEHKGIIEALNTGLAACRGKYIARMDADDIAYPERLEKQVDFLESREDVTVAGCLVEGFPRDQVRGGFRVYISWLNSLVSDSDLRREMFVESPLAHPSVMFRTEDVIGAGGYQDHGWPEDYDLWLRLYIAGKKFGKVNQVLLSWREYPERLTRTDSRYSLENFLRAKAHYLMMGPLRNRDAVIIWGGGMAGRRLSKHLLREGAPLRAFVDIDPRKIGNTRR
ncbi:MAG: glycosyltransferase, partial [Chloroflexi bacterium]